MDSLFRSSFLINFEHYARDANLEILRKTNNNHTLLAVFMEYAKLLCGLIIGQRRRQTIPMRNNTAGKGILLGITVCLVSTILSTM